MKILIADNEKNFVELLRMNLALNGHAADVAYDGKAALRLIQTNHYDLAFLDFNMPELTGLELAKYIKENNIRTKVIMITGYDMMNEKLAKCVGVDEYLTKPFRIEDVKNVIARCGGKQEKP
ncbi:MAG: response regulator [Candidatus Omnitrophica bacterium]|nr:response regulator [Candidatus Omnitrophota bacterium]MDD5437000.1 response regulator [Candidatus Omnitrophota bacterium]